MKTTTPTLAWLAAVSAALMLAYATPNESHVMGHLPASFAAKRLDQQPMAIPGELPAERTLALVAYTKAQRDEIDSWIRGLRLDTDSAIPWFRMPVLEDPGTAAAREQIESKMLAHHAGADRSRYIPMFTNREAFARAAGLSSTDHAAVLVLNRDGKVLARAEGPFDEDKARALRETLLARRD
jgi:hypothetical protein